MMGCMLSVHLSCPLQVLITSPRKMLHLAFSCVPSLPQLKRALRQPVVWLYETGIVELDMHMIQEIVTSYVLTCFISPSVMTPEILLQIYLFDHFFPHMLMILWRPIQLVRECTKLELDRQKPVSILHKPSVTISHKGSAHLAISITRYSDFIQTINLQPEKNWMSEDHTKCYRDTHFTQHKMPTGTRILKFQSRRLSLSIITCKKNKVINISNISATTITLLEIHSS